jgi:hypothetical protein
MIDEASFRKRQAVGAYKGFTWETFRNAELKNEAGLSKWRAQHQASARAQAQEMLRDPGKMLVRRRDGEVVTQAEAASRIWDPVKGESGSKKFFRGLMKGLTGAADVAAEHVAGKLGQSGDMAASAYKLFAPPGSKFYTANKGAKLRQVAQEALSAGVGQLKDKAIDYAKTRGAAVVRRFMSAAKGGRVVRGGDVRVHKRELIVPARRAMPLIAALRKSKIAVPMRALKGK